MFLYDDKVIPKVHCFFGFMFEQTCYIYFQVLHTHTEQTFDFLYYFYVLCILWQVPQKNRTPKTTPYTKFQLIYSMCSIHWCVKNCAYGIWTWIRLSTFLCNDQVILEYVNLWYRVRPDIYEIASLIIFDDNPLITEIADNTYVNVIETWHIINVRYAFKTVSNDT